MPSLDLPVYERTSLDNSILSTLGRCPRLAFFNYHLCRSARAKNYPINFGVAFHKFAETLEQLYINWVLEEGQELEKVKGVLFTAAFAVATAKWEDPPLEHKKSYLDLGRLSKNCKDMFERWEREKESGIFEVIGTETAFELPLPSGRNFSGRLDQPLLWNNRAWIRDWKTVSRRPKNGDYRAKYNPDHQFTGYTWGFGKLANRTIDGVLVDTYHNIKSSGPNFDRTPCSRTNSDIKQWLEFVEDGCDEWERRVESGKWPMRTAACDDWGGCYFRSCCNEGAWRDIESWLKEHTIYSVWDPMRPEREEGLPE